MAFREPTHPEDAANVAFLVEYDREEDFLDAAETIASDWEGRIALRLLGPLAPYDFLSPHAGSPAVGQGGQAPA